YRKTGWCLFFWAVIVLVNAAQTDLLTIENGGILNEKFYFGAAPLVAVQAGLMFLLLKNVDVKSVLYRTTWLRAGVTMLSQHSYNIYRNHALLLWLVVKGALGFSLSHETSPSPVVGVTLTTIAVLLLSVGLSRLLQKIPVLSKLLVITLPRAPQTTVE